MPADPAWKGACWRAVWNSFDAASIPGSQVGGRDPRVTHSLYGFDELGRVPKSLFGCRPGTAAVTDEDEGVSLHVQAVYAIHHVMCGGGFVDHLAEERDCRQIAVAYLHPSLAPKALARNKPVPDRLGNVESLLSRHLSSSRVAGYHRGDRLSDESLAQPP